MRAQRCQVQAEGLVDYPGDLRKRCGAARVPLSPTDRQARIKLKARAWDLAHMDKRRTSDRRSKARSRALHGRRPWTPSHDAWERKLARDRAYSHRRYLMGLQKPQPTRLFSLDMERGEDGGTLHDVVPLDQLSPLDILILKEEALARKGDIL